LPESYQDKSVSRIWLLQLGMLDVERVMALGSADGFKDELNNLMTLLLKRVQRLNGICIFLKSLWAL